MKLKKFSVLILTIMIAIGVSGCMQEKIDVSDKILSYMNEKYDDTFTYKAPYGGGPGATTLQRILTSEKYPDKEIWIEYYEDRNGNSGLIDNYVGVKYEQQTAELINDIMSRILDEDFAVLYSAPFNAATKGASKEMTFEQYIAEPSSDITFIVIVDNHKDIDKESLSRNLEAALVDNGMCCRIGDVYFDVNGKYNDISINEVESYIIKKQYKNVFSFSMPDNESFDFSEWR